MSETFMAGDYPQESLFLWTAMIFVDATNLHFSQEFIYADDRSAYKTLQKLSTIFIVSMLIKIKFIYVTKSL